MYQDLFVTYLVQEFRDLGIRNVPDQKLRRIALFLIQSQLISTKTIRHFTIIREYEKMAEQGKFRNKTLLIRAMARKLGTHENTIWNILKDHKVKYQSSLTEKSEPNQ